MGLLTGAGHGGRVGVRPVEARVTLTDPGALFERVAVGGALGAPRVGRFGLVEADGTGCKQTHKKKTEGKFLSVLG